jgi:hypothetical protein
MSKIMSRVNKHGLPRTIPADVERSVRQRCKFSCVVCKNGIIQYHHFRPVYAEALSHDPEGITLLCASCHDRVTKGIDSAEIVIAADKKRREEKPDAQVALRLTSPLTVVVGSVILLGNEVSILVEGETLIRVRPSDYGGVELSGTFYNKKGEIVLCIEDNVIKVRAENWDADMRGSTLTVRSGLRSIVLELQLQMPRVVRVKSLLMERNGWRIDTDDKGHIVFASDDVNAPPASVDFNDSYMVLQGTMSLVSGSCTISGGVCMGGAYDGKRFKQLCDAKQYDKLVHEILKQEVLHVTKVGDCWGIRTGKGVNIQGANKEDLCYPSIEMAKQNSRSIAQQMDARIVLHQENGNLEYIYLD